MADVYLVTGSEDGPIATTTSALRAIAIASNSVANDTSQSQTCERELRAANGHWTDLLQNGYVELDGELGTAEVRAVQLSNEQQAIFGRIYCDRNGKTK